MDRWLIKYSWLAQECKLRDNRALRALSNPRSNFEGWTIGYLCRVWREDVMYPKTHFPELVNLSVIFAILLEPPLMWPIINIL